MAHEIRNISSTGFYLLTMERWHPGTVITMTLQRSDVAKGEENSNAEHHISVLSKVIRLGKDGVGLAFVPIEARSSDLAKVPRHKPADKKTLDRFLEQLKSDQGHVIIGHTGENLGMRVVDRNATSTTPGGDIMKRLKDESGQALIITALCMTCLFGFVALATDVGLALREKRLLQTAADSAAIAGALELNYNPAGVTAVAQKAAVTAAALAAAGQNGYAAASSGTTTASGLTVTVNNPPLNGPHSGLTDTSYVEVIVSQQKSTIFMSLFGVFNLTPTVRAVAQNGGSSTGCVYVLSPNADAALNLQGSFLLNTPNCGIIIDSNKSDALSFTGNAGDLYAGSIGVVGGVSGSPKNTISPVTGIVPQSDPFAGKTQGSPPVPGTLSPACSVPTASSSSAGSSGGKKSPPTLSGNVVGPTTTGGTVCYSGTVNITNANFPAGTYVFTGDVNVSGTFTSAQPSAGNLGNGATFDIDSGTFSVATGTTFGIYAPQSGSYNGIVLMQPSTNSNTMTLQSGNAYGTIDGIIYAPSAQLYLNDSGGDKSGGITLITDLIVGQLFDKTAALSIQSYSQTNPGTTPLTKVALVE
jgi:Flp pilus assembly protein TadG